MRRRHRPNRGHPRQYYQPSRFEADRDQVERNERGRLLCEAILRQYRAYRENRPVDERSQSEAA